jgi:methylated-DNA-protein-cysteine methyltransferase related protein
VETQRERFFDVIRRIPRGQVATYGDIAAIAGSPHAAREVGWALSSVPPGSDVPWWRVVNRQGGISLRPYGAERQAQLLRQEGVAVSDEGFLELQRYRWDGKS